MVHELQARQNARHRIAQQRNPAHDLAGKPAGLHFRVADRGVRIAQGGLDQVGDIAGRYLIVMLLKDVESAAAFAHGPVGISRPPQACRLDLHAEARVATQKRFARLRRLSDPRHPPRSKCRDWNRSVSEDTPA
jgi:hypothetical protein